MTGAARLAQLDAQAEALVKAGASASAFDPLIREGWKPLSLREGSGLDPCPATCGVCFPVFSATRRKRGR